MEEKISEIIYMYAHGVEEDAMTNGEATKKILDLMQEEFERGRRDMFTAIDSMGMQFEGAFLLKISFLNALEQQLEESQKRNSIEK